MNKDIFFAALLCLFFSYINASAFEVEIIPSEIRPGDAFVVAISEARMPEMPSAFFGNKRMLFSSCGDSCFVALGAVDVETEPGDYVLRVNSGGNRRDIGLTVLSTQFPVRHITLPEEKVFLNPKDLERAQKEAEKLKALWRVATAKLWEGSFILPLENDISTQFGIKRIINKKKNSRHRGIDVRGGHGETVKASNRGRVVLAEDLFFGGNTIVLDHGHGVYTIYMHLSKFNVRQEEIVSKGDVIGFVGSTGRSTGPHLHFGVKVMETNTNPVSFVKLKLHEID